MGKKIIKLGISALRILGLVVSALGLVGCALAQKDGSFWDENYELALNATGFGTDVVLAVCIVDFFTRLEHVNRKTYLHWSRLKAGIAIIIAPFVWAFIVSDVRAIHVATFTAAVGICIALGFVSKEPEEVVEVDTVIIDECDEGYDEN